MRLHGFAFSVLLVLNPPFGLLAEGYSKIDGFDLAEVTRGIGAANLNDFPRAMFAFGFSHGTRTTYRANADTAMNAFFLPGYVFPEPDYVMLAFSLNRTTLSGSTTHGP